MSTEEREAAATLTLDALRAAMRSSEESHLRARKAATERIGQFYAGIPENLRSHPLVVEMATLIMENIPIHPDRHAKLRERLDALVRGVSE